MIGKAQQHGAYQMFTFGRDHEKACAVRYVRDTSQAPLITSVIDAVHDLLESRIAEEHIRPVIAAAFVQGGAGVWEQVGSWLRKLGCEYPQLQSMWIEFANHSEWKVRFRAACFISDLPLMLAAEVGAKLKNDRSAKVRKMTLSRLSEIEATISER